MKNRQFSIFNFIKLLSLSFILSANVQNGWAVGLEEIKQLDQEVLQQKKQLDRVQTSISSHQNRIQESKEQEINLLNELMRINQQIINESDKLILLKEKMEQQDKLTQEKEAAMQHVVNEQQIIEEHMQNRLAAYYRMGDIGIMNVTFSSSSISELLSFRESFHHLLQYDKRIISIFKNKMVELDLIRQEHNAEKERLEKVAEDIREQQKLLSATKQEEQKILERVKIKGKLYQQAITEMESAAKELAQNLIELEANAEKARQEKKFKNSPITPSKKLKPVYEREFAAQKGKLPLPVNGAILKTFGKHTNTVFEVSTFTNGIDIEAGPGAEIKAVFPGKVVYAGTLRGYGKLILIDHGDHYYTLVSGVKEIHKQVEDQVSRDEIIAIASTHTGLLQEGLHFEIRHKSEALDPLEWVDASKLTFKNE